MKSTIFFRITAVMFVLFAVGHTAGFLTYKPPTTEGLAVLNAMNSVHFTDAGKNFSYGGWYRGFGLTATVSMAFQAVFAWILGSMAKRRSTDVAALGWAFLIWQLPSLVLAWIYFPIPAIFLTALVSVLIAIATVLAIRNNSQV